MVWGRKGMAKLVGGSAAKMARNIPKVDFLRQLKVAWRPYVKKHTSIEDELAAATDRINSSPFKSSFEAVGVTDEDIRTILEEIREEKVDPIKYEHAKTGRNEPCPCGAKKKDGTPVKYKHCCGK